MEHALFNQQTIQDCLWVEPEEITSIQVIDRHTAEVTFKVNGQEYQWRVTKTDVLDGIVRSRKKRSEHITVTNNGDGSYKAYNPIKETSYTIKPYLDKVTCSCKDWCNLSISLDTEQVACKHVYSYLNYLGFGNLPEYIAEMNRLSSRLEQEQDEYLQRLEYNTLAHSDVDLHAVDY